MSDRIKKFLDSLDAKTREKIKEYLLEIKKNPFLEGGDIKKLKKHKNCYRLRIGKIRIVYEVTKEDIEIIDIDYRGNIY